MDLNLDSQKVWKPSLNNKYMVSEYGDIVNVSTGKVLNPKPYASGYARTTRQVTSTNNGAVHRAVYEAFVGKIPEGMQINHLDGNKLNNHISNLEVCTPSENIKHAFDMGLAKVRRGEEANNKVTEEQVLQMYGLFKLGYSNDYLGEYFNIHSRYVSLIRHGKRWKHLFESENMVETWSLGNLPFNLSKCVYIYNKCILSNKAQDTLAEELGIDSSTVSRIRTGKTWKAFRRLYGIPLSTDDWKNNRQKLACQ